MTRRYDQNMDGGATHRLRVVEEILVALLAGQSVAVRGEAGIGKTAVLDVVAERWRLQSGAAKGAADPSANVLRGNASLSARRVSLAALGGLVRRDTTSVAAAINDLRETPGLLLVDDADLLDDDSAVVLHTLGSERPIVFSMRPGRSDPADAIVRLANRPSTRRFDIGPLTMQESIALIEKQLGGPIGGDCWDELLSAGEGNPLLVGELVAATQRHGAVQHQHGIWILREMIAGTNVREVFRDRIRSWPEGVRRVVACVAMAEQVPLAVLSACFTAADVNEAVALDAFHRQLNGEVVLRHALLRDAMIAHVEYSDRLQLLRLLVATADLARQTIGEVSPLRRGLWLLALGDHDRIDTDLVLRAAKQALDSSQLMIARDLATMAYRFAPSPETLRLLVRLRIAPIDTDPNLDEALRLESLTGRFEEFSFGLGADDGLVNDLSIAQNTDSDEDRRYHYEIFTQATEWLTGSSLDTPLHELTRLSRLHPASDGAMVAAIFGANVALFAGRFQLGLSLVTDAEISFPTDNPLYVTQVAFGKAEALLRLGRLSEAKAAAESLRRHALTTVSARLYVAAFDAQLLRHLGQLRAAARTLATLLSDLDGLNPLGIGTWAHAWLAVNRAALGEDRRGYLPPLEAPENGKYVSHELRLAAAYRHAELGYDLHARNEALAVVDDASAAGCHETALWSAHLAVRLQATRSSASLVATIGARVEGDIPSLLELHATALANSDAAGLEKAALLFIEVEHFGLAHEAFVQAAEMHRKQAQRSASSRCASRAKHMVETGVDPLFGARNRMVRVEGLTLREREVSLVVAQGLTHRAVGDALGMSHRTVETHLHRAYRKLNVTSVEALRLLLADARDGEHT